MSLTITRPAIPVPLPLTRGGLEATTPAGGRATLELGDLAQLTAPGGTSTFLRADKTWAVPPSGGGGSTTLLGLTDVPDTYTGQATKVLAVKTDETGTEFVTPTAGGGAPTDAEYITSTLNGTLSAERVLTDTATITWDRATAGEIKANAVGGGGYTDEQAQDAVGAMLLDTATIDLTYTDATPSLSADVKDASITEAKLSLSDVTTKDASTTAHGLLRKLPGTATQYLDGSGAWTTPAGGAQYWSRTAGGTPSYMTGCLAWWRLEEASGNRVDSVSALALAPQGSVGTLTNAAGKTGSALAMNGTTGAYLSLADTATVSVGTSTSFTIACWVYFQAGTGGAEWGMVGKGNVSSTQNTCEYHWYLAASAFRFVVGNGSSRVDRAYPGLTATAGQWYFLVGWWDAGTLSLQINNGTVDSSAWAAGSYDSTLPFEVGRQLGYTAATSYLNGRVDNIMFWRRALTTQERTDLWNGGNSVDYGFTPGSMLSPATATDRLVLAAVSTTQERLEVDGAIKVGTTTGTTDGTLRWSGTDFEGRKGGAWVSMTAGGGGQPLDATLTALAGLATGADQLPYATGTDTFSQTTLTTFARTLLDDTTQAQVQTTLALVPGTHVQAQDAELQAIAGLTSAADRVPYFTGLGTAALATFTAAGRTLVGAADAAAQRTALGLSTMATQDASAVAITGGAATGLSMVTVGTGGLYPLDVNGQTRLNASVGIKGPPDPNIGILVQWTRATGPCFRLKHADTDGGNSSAFEIYNLAGAAVGSITTTGSATAFNTSSDVRLKHAITPLTGALAVVQALRPITHLWNADGSRGYGFLAHELQREIPDAVTGEADAVNEDGSVKPQQVDHSKLVVWLVGACQELAARVTSLEQQLGV
jgi:hypothetical protein